MGPDRVVVASPVLDDDLGLTQSVEDFRREQLIAKASTEALDVADDAEVLSLLLISLAAAVSLLDTTISYSAQEKP